MAAKASWHRYGTKLRHCHPMYTYIQLHRLKTIGRRLKGKGKDSPCSITERRVPELIPLLGSQPAGDVSHKLGGRLPLLSARPAVTLATVATNFAAR